MSDAIIELKDVGKFYGDMRALADINLTIKNGEFLTLLGPSGCGKTTILRILSGFETPSSGEVWINGVCVNDIPPEKRQVNTVFQNYALFPHMNVEQNVAFGLKMQGVPKDEIARRVLEALRIVHLESYTKRRPSQLSGGQQQRVAIARAIVNKPLVLLLDEPFSALDFKLRKEMQIEIKHLQRKLGITFIFVTHDQEEAFAMSDRVVVMNQGHIAQTGTPKHIYEEPENLFVARFVGQINILDATVARVCGDGAYTARIDNETFPIKSRRTFLEGEKVHVLLRPEDLKVDSPGLIDGPSFSGIIEETVYKGATVDIFIRLESGRRLVAAEFFNEEEEDINYNPGERVSVGWVDGWEVVLPAREEAHEG